MRRICVIRFGAIGDLLMTTPTLRALKARYPDAEITVVTGSGMRPVLEANPVVSTIVEFDKRDHGRASRLAAFCAPLRGEQFDLVVNLQRSVKSVLMAWMLRPRRILTHRTRDGVGVGGRRRHGVDNFLDTLHPLGIDPAQCDRHLDWFVPDHAKQSLRAVLAGVGIGDNDKVMLVNPGATAVSRRWTSVQLAEILETLETEFPEYRLVVCGGRGVDQELAAGALSGRATTVVDLTGRTTLAEAAALLERASLLVTGDTGPMHMAAAIGTPMVALFGATDPDRTGPMDPSPSRRRGNALPMVLADRENLSCAPCMSRTCKRGDQECLRRLGPDRVVDAVRRVLADVARVSTGNA